MPCAKERVLMTTDSRLRRVGRFMGFRDCPACGEPLFAAEHAVFVCESYVTPSWRCDACDHVFQTPVDTQRDPAARAAA
jgi:transposase-like protein